MEELTRPFFVYRKERKIDGRVLCAVAAYTASTMILYIYIDPIIARRWIIRSVYKLNRVRRRFSFFFLNAGTNKYNCRPTTTTTTFPIYR